MIYVFVERWWRIRVAVAENEVRPILLEKPLAAAAMERRRLEVRVVRVGRFTVFPVAVAHDGAAGSGR